MFLERERTGYLEGNWPLELFPVWVFFLLSLLDFPPSLCGTKPGATDKVLDEVFWQRSRVNGCFRMLHGAGWLSRRESRASCPHLYLCQLPSHPHKQGTLDSTDQMGGEAEPSASQRTRWLSVSACKEERKGRGSWRLSEILGWHYTTKLRFYLKSSTTSLCTRSLLNWTCGGSTQDIGIMWSCQHE